MPKVTHGVRKKSLDWFLLGLLSSPLLLFAISISQVMGEGWGLSRDGFQAPERTGAVRRVSPSFPTSSLTRYTRWLAHLGPGPRHAPGAAQTPAARAAGSVRGWSCFWRRAGCSRGRQGRRSGGPAGAAAAPSRRGGWPAPPAAASPGLAPASPARCGAGRTGVSPSSPQGIHTCTLSPGSPGDFAVQTGAEAEREGERPAQGCTAQRSVAQNEEWRKERLRHGVRWIWVQ